MGDTFMQNVLSIIQKKSSSFWQFFASNKKNRAYIFTNYSIPWALSKLLEWVCFDVVSSCLLQMLEFKTQIVFVLQEYPNSGNNFVNTEGRQKKLLAINLSPQKSPFLARKKKKLRPRNF